MKLLTRAVDFLLYTSLFTASCATGLCMATEQFIDHGRQPVFSALHVLIFGSTLVVYNAPRIMPKIRGTLRKVRKMYVATFAAGCILVLCSVLWVPSVVLAYAAVLAVLAFAYSLPLLPFKNKRRLREFGWVKILVLAGVWTIATSVLPMIDRNISPAAYPVEVLVRFSLIFSLCIVFDIRDMGTDGDNQIDTFPHKVGLANSYRMINLTLCVFLMLSGAQYVRHPQLNRLVAAFATAFMAWIVVNYLKRKPSDRAYMGLADGVMLFYSVFALWQ